MNLRFWRFVMRFFGAMDTVRESSPADWAECLEVEKKSLGYGLFYNGREVWSHIHGDFLASRWFDSLEEAASQIPNAKADLQAAGLYREVASPIGEERP